MELIAENGGVFGQNVPNEDSPAPADNKPEPESAQHIRTWLERQNLGEYANSFIENEIDADGLLTLTEDDLYQLGVVKLGHRKQIMRAIELFRNAMLANEAVQTNGNNQGSESTSSSNHTHSDPKVHHPSSVPTAQAPPPPTLKLKQAESPTVHATVVVPSSPQIPASIPTQSPTVTRLPSKDHPPAAPVAMPQSPTLASSPDPRVSPQLKPLTKKDSVKSPVGATTSPSPAQAPPVLVRPPSLARLPTLQSRHSVHHMQKTTPQKQPKPAIATQKNSKSCTIQ